MLGTCLKFFRAPQTPQSKNPLTTSPKWLRTLSRLLDVGLEQLTAIVLKMSEVAEKTVGTSIAGFMDGRDVSEQVRELSEMLVAMTVSVEDKAFELIVKYQPVASDLRIINSYMKIAYDFERYGRYAWDISFTQSSLLQRNVRTPGISWNV